MVARRARGRRDVVTPDDLNVSAALLGAPLAPPLRRMLAIGVDLIVVALLSNVGNLWLLAGLVLLALLHLNPPRVSVPRRRLLWALGAVLLAAGAAQVWIDADDAPAAGAGVRHAHAVASALAASDAAALTPLEAAQQRIATLERELKEARQPKPFDWRAQWHAWRDDVGLGLGWTIAYFSLLPVWWRGQTIGKRLFGLRIVELTGKPLTPLRAFKRYGGYAAGMATGLFGFLQVLWDPNRQAIQDKTAHTVVIDVRRRAGALPGDAP